MFETFEKMFVISDALKDLSFYMALSVICTVIDELIVKHGKDATETYTKIADVGIAVNEQLGSLKVS